MAAVRQARVWVPRSLSRICDWGRAHPTLLSPRSVASRIECACLASTLTCPPAKAAVYHAHGPPENVLKVVELPGRDLHDGEVCVKMLAAPINPSDINRVEGVYPIRPSLPAVGGTEGVGVVIATTPGVSSLKVHDWVIPAQSLLGTWRTHIAKEESAWCRVVRDVPAEYAATVAINPCTALRMLSDVVHLEPGDLVVQNGATSMVGQCVIQLARIRNLHSINLVRDRPDLDEVKARLKALGAEDVLSEGEMSGQDKKMFLAGRREPKLGLNCVGGSAANAVLKLLGEGSIMVTYGGMAKKPITVPTGPLIFKDLRLQGFWLEKWKTKHTREEFAVMANYLLGLIRDGKLKYTMEKVPFSDFEAALQKALGKHGSVSKQVLIFD